MSLQKESMTVWYVDYYLHPNVLLFSHLWFCQPAWAVFISTHGQEVWINHSTLSSDA